MSAPEPGTGALAQAKAHVMAAVVSPDSHPSVRGVGIGRDDQGNEVVVVLVEGDERTVDEVRALCSPDDIAVDLRTRITFRAAPGR